VLLAVAAMIAMATVFEEMEVEDFPTRWVLVLRRQEAEDSGAAEAAAAKIRETAAAAVPRQEKAAVQQEETATATVPRQEKVAVRRQETVGVQK
jgi:hypothetical protein